MLSYELLCILFWVHYDADCSLVVDYIALRIKFHIIAAVVAAVAEDIVDL